MQDHASQTPEAGSPATWYGSCIHDVIEYVGDGFTNEAAIEKAWAKWGSHLYPEDLALLKADIELHGTRDFQNVRTILSEGEIKVPLTTMDDGREIWFRGRIDRLYERLDRPGHFIHIDYKSGKWGKTQDEVDEDPQMWAYNWMIREYFPECEVLDQHLDQLRHGLVPTSKTAAQLQEVREWLCLEARNYFAEPELQQDALPAPRFNQWCAWCPIAESCTIIPWLSDWALFELEVLSPDEIASAVTPMTEYVERYDSAQNAIKVLERYVDSVKGLVRRSPQDQQTTLGFKLGGRSNSIIDARAREALYEGLGHDQFVKMAGITKEKLKSIEDEELREWALGLVEKVPGPQQVVQRLRR